MFVTNPMQRSERKLVLSFATFILGLVTYHALVYSRAAGDSLPIGWVLFLVCPYWGFAGLFAFSDGLGEFLAVPLLAAEVFAYAVVIRQAQARGRLLRGFLCLSAIHVMTVGYVAALFLCSWWHGHY